MASTCLRMLVKSGLATASVVRQALPPALQTAALPSSHQAVVVPITRPPSIDLKSGTSSATFSGFGTNRQSTTQEIRYMVSISRCGCKGRNGGGRVLLSMTLQRTSLATLCVDNHNVCCFAPGLADQSWCRSPGKKLSSMAGRHDRGMVHSH